MLGPKYILAEHTFSQSKGKLMQFQDFNLDELIIGAIAKQGYETPSDIQREAIPVLLEGNRDFVGQAQTGTGKTAAFVLPLLQKIYSEDLKGTQALILTPTRELAAQVEGEIQKFNMRRDCNSVVVYGGASYDRQISSIKKKRPQIIVGTPGRVMDLMDKGYLDFSKAQYLILDEADEMLNMGFFEDVQEILKSFNEKRNMWMFSATMPREIVRLIEEECNDPYTITVKKKTLSNDNIEQKFFVVNRRQRFEALYRIVISEDEMHGIVFCRTKVDTKDVAEQLLDRGLKVTCLNGDMGQSERDNAMAKFKAHKSNIMVCTDVAARGIDVNDLTHVFNYGLPQNAESYVHRIGRTGRAGKTGMAISLVDPGDIYLLRKIENTTNKKLTKVDIPTSNAVKAKMIERNMAKIGPILEAVVDKGDKFQIDPAYEVYENFFKETSKEDLQKIMFTYIFNKELRRLDDLGEITSNRRNSDRRTSPGRRTGGAGRGRRDDRGPRRGDRDRSSRSDRTDRSARAGERGNFKRRRSSSDQNSARRSFRA